MTTSVNPSHDRTHVSRRHLLAGAVGVPVALLAAGAVGTTAQAAPSVTGGAGPRWRGADVSFQLQLEQAGVTWSAGGRTLPLERLLRRAGANWVRLRVWVDPPAGYSTAETAIVLARRARAAGHHVLLDLHYSDFWADPAHQTTPAAWAGQDLTQLTETVRSYTRAVLEQFSAAGVPVDAVQVGNEITAGMLWPLGQVYGGPTDSWDGFTALLRAGVQGAREAQVRGPAPQVMVHVDRGGDNGGSRWFYDHVFERGVECDLIGQSYYPFWHGPIADLEANLVDLAGRYDKDLVVVETAYPWTLENGDDLTNIIATADQLPDVAVWPPTPEGQLAYFAALRDVFARVPGRHGLGFVTWEPEWVPGVGWAPGEGNPNDNLTLFDHDGQALPALSVFSPGRMAVR